MPERTGVAQERPDLAVLNLASCPAVLPFHPHRMGALLDEPAFVDHADAIGVTERLAHKLHVHIARRVRIPVGLVQQALRGIWGLIPHDFRHLPAVLACNRRQQGSQVLDDLLARLATHKQVGKASMEGGEVVRPLIQFFACHGPSGVVCSPPLSPDCPSWQVRL